MRKIFLLLIPIFLIVSCKKKGTDGEVTPTTQEDDSTDDNSFNIFSIQQDKELGLQVVAQLESDSSEYVVMEPTDYPDAYEHLDRITNTILNSGVVKYRDEFE